MISNLQFAAYPGAALKAGTPAPGINPPAIRFGEDVEKDEVNLSAAAPQPAAEPVDIDTLKQQLEEKVNTELAEFKAKLNEELLPALRAATNEVAAEHPNLFEHAQAIMQGQKPSGLSDDEFQGLQQAAAAFGGKTNELLAPYQEAIQAEFNQVIEKLTGNPDTKITREVQRYLVIKTLVSLATGVSVGVWVHLVGLDFPFLLGLIAFVLNYVPNIGSILAAVPGVALAVVQLSVPRMLLIVLGYAVINLWWGNLVEPHVMGRQLKISPLAVFVSLLFWGYVWGMMGMLLAVPITMVLKILFENSERLRWLGLLLDPPTREASG